MRNRAKCRLCKDTIESTHRHDYITCSCGEISVDGGSDYHRAVFKNRDNFICIDDEDNEIIPMYKAPDVVSACEQEKDNLVHSLTKPRPSKEELILELDIMIKNIEKLPPQALYAPVSHADFGSLLILVHAILKYE